MGLIVLMMLAQVEVHPASICYQEAGYTKCFDNRERKLDPRKLDSLTFRPADERYNIIATADDPNLVLQGRICWADGTCIDKNDARDLLILRNSHDEEMARLKASLGRALWWIVIGFFVLAVLFGGLLNIDKLAAAWTRAEIKIPYRGIMQWICFLGSPIAGVVLFGGAVRVIELFARDAAPPTAYYLSCIAGAVLMTWMTLAILAEED